MTNEKKPEEPLTTTGAQKQILKIVTSADAKWFVATMASVAVGAVLVVTWGSDAMDRKVDKRGATLQAQITENKKTIDATVAELKAEVKEAVRASTRAEVMTEILLKNE